MHILVTNDDGPPSPTSSPYILPFVRSLQSSGHTVSVILPDTQRSWIGKAHIVGQDVTATPYWPPPAPPALASQLPNSSSPSGAAAGAAAAQTHDNSHDADPWILVNSTPASCAQLGLSHTHTFYPSHSASAPKPDLVISGPNYGRNTTAVFALSSGTLGAALESTVCGYRSIALSFAFFSKSPTEPEVVDEACRHSVRICEFLAREAEWGEGRLYSVNVPLLRGVGGKRVLWTRMLQNEWRRGACFQEVEASDVAQGGGDAGVEEERRFRMREEVGEGEGAEGGGSEENGGGGGLDGEYGNGKQKKWRKRHFKWAPRFTDVYDAVQQAGPGSDGWAVKEGETSITAIRANFMHASPSEGEVKL